MPKLVNTGITDQTTLNFYFSRMRFFRIVLGNLWRFWFFFEAVVTFFLLFPFFVITLSGKAPYHRAFWWMQLHARLIVFLSGIRVKVIRNYQPDKNKTYLICPNHISYLDIVVTYVAFPHYFHFMGKAELERVPLFNIFFKRMNIGVNRASRSASHKAYLRAGSDLQNHISIAIFPEATIPPCNPQLGPMKNGAFKLAVENQVSILPVCYVDHWKLLPDSPRRIFGGRPGIARVVIDKPVEVKGLTLEDVPQIKNTYRQRMDAMFATYHYGYGTGES